MTSTETRPPGPETASPAELPLQPEDPPRIGNFWLLGRIAANAAGYLYTARDEMDRTAVVVMMTEGSADDAAARDRFDTAVDGLPDELVLGRNSTDESDMARWVALAPVTTADGDPGSSSAADARRAAERHGEDVLSAVLMDRIPHLGRFRGPDFLHYWDGRRRPGLFRLWPLPWPGRLKTASWLAMLLALLTMMILMVVALFIAWLLFEDEPLVDPGPVIPNPNGTRTVTVTPSSPPTSGSGSPSPSQSPSPGQTTGGSPSTSPGQSPTPGQTTGPPTEIPTGIPSSGTPPTDPGDRF